MNKSALAALLILVVTSPALAAGGAGTSSGAGSVSRGGSGSLGGWTMPHGGAGSTFGRAPARDAWTHPPSAPLPDRNRRIRRSAPYVFEQIPRCEVILNPALVSPIAYWPGGKYCGTRVFVGSSIYATPWLPGAEATMFPLNVQY